MTPELAAELIDWYRHCGRDLPWRRTRDPYAVLVSEIMLQQTRVETVLGRYESFLERFPTVAALAAAPLDGVLAEWSGLGYYRRARSLHALAKRIVDEHGGRIPDDLDALLALPGIGHYTAAAIGSISFGLAALSVDGNVGRILCRIAAIEDDPRRAPVRRALEAMVADAMAIHAAGELNQAIMEAGARICLPKTPRCAACPAARFCEARARGIEETIPPANRSTTRAVTELAAVVHRDDRYLLLRGQRPSLVQDMWEFPTLDSRLDRKRGRASKKRLEQYLEGLGWPVELGAKLGEIRHGMTDRRISCRVYEGFVRRRTESVVADGGIASAEVVAAPAGPGPQTPEAGWFTVTEAARLPLAASARKTLQQLLDADLAAT